MYTSSLVDARDQTMVTDASRAIYVVEKSLALAGWPAHGSVRTDLMSGLR